MTVSHKHLGEFCSSLKQYLKSVAGERDCFQWVPPAAVLGGPRGSGGSGEGTGWQLPSRKEASERLRQNSQDLGCRDARPSNLFAWVEECWRQGGASPRSGLWGWGQPLVDRPTAEAEEGGMPHGLGLTPFPRSRQRHRSEVARWGHLHRLRVLGD